MSIQSSLKHSYEEIQNLRSSRDLNERRRCIAILKQVLGERSGDVEVWFDLASCHDYLGQSAEAEDAYRSAVGAGFANLPLPKQPRLFLQFGSTLRNNRKVEEALSVLEDGAQKFPKHAALKAFLALAFTSSGDHFRCSRSLASAILLSQEFGWDGYEGALKNYFVSEKLVD